MLGCSQLYLPPNDQLNKHFLKLVLSGEKDLLKMTELRPINAPHYDEISVKNILPRVAKDEAIMRYLPTNLPNGRVIDRTYFFNVLNTVQPKYMSGIIEHANRMRNTAADSNARAEQIVVTPEWLEQLEKVPFMSSKCS